MTHKVSIAVKKTPSVNSFARIYDKKVYMTHSST
jgi:hypothetical protein